MDTASTFITINPATGEPANRYPHANEATVHQAVTQARTDGPFWADQPLSRRASVLRQIAKALGAQAGRLAEVITQETGKPRAHALEGDVATALNVFHYTASVGPSVLRAHVLCPDLFSMVSGRLHRMSYHSRGVLGVISPWNYPLAIPASSMAAALMAGNAVVLKPSELAHGAGQLLVDIVQSVLRQEGLPTGLVACVGGDGRTGGTLVQADIDGILFTGSTQTGRRIRAQLAERGVWCSMELGGSDPMIVLPQAPLETAMSFAVWGRYVNAGQACAAVKRLYVPTSRLDESLALLKEKIVQLRVGGPDDPGVHVGPLISAEQREQVHAQVQDACQRGAQCLTGGEKREGPGWFYTPTLLCDVPADARVLNEEVFGPVLSVVPYDDEAEVIAMANRSAYGLTASVFGPASAAEALARHLHCGSVIINDVGASNYAMVSAPWGGWKASGLGASHGKQVLRDMSRAKITSRNLLAGLPGLSKPIWHFGRHSGGQDLQRAQTVIALAARHMWPIHPVALRTFWENRDSTKL